MMVVCAATSWHFQYDFTRYNSLHFSIYPFRHLDHARRLPDGRHWQLCSLPRNRHTSRCAPNNDPYRGESWQPKAEPKHDCTIRDMPPTQDHPQGLHNQAHGSVQKCSTGRPKEPMPNQLNLAVHRPKEMVPMSFPTREKRT